MKKNYLVFAIAGITLFSCNSTAQDQEDKKETTEQTASADNSYGAEFDANGSISVQDFTAQMASTDVMENVTVEGEIAEVCQAMGCWVKLKNDHGEDVMIKFKDHEFFVPKDIAGKYAIVHGYGEKKEISVEERRHMAEDAGQSEEEIAMITEPKKELQIEAAGIIVK